MTSPFEIEGQLHHLSASIGIAIAPFDGADADTLLKHALAAQAEARREGHNQWRFFEPALAESDRLKHALEHDLRRALEESEFELDYQPQYRLDTGEVTGVEALLRWRHPTRGRVSPMDFIPVAEEAGLIIPIGRWVLQQACRDALAWPSSVRVAVNVSSVQISGPSLVTDVQMALAASGLSPGRLELEITEAVLLHDTDRTLAMLGDLHRLGVHLAMDDFGTGYSSLSYLRRFPFDRLKIDRSFVCDLEDDAHAQAIVRAIASLGSSLGMAITVEGVETEAQRARALAEGCGEAQGYLLSRPMPAHRIAAALAAAPWRPPAEPQP